MALSLAAKNRQELFTRMDIELDKILGSKAGYGMMREQGTASSVAFNAAARA